MNVTQPCGRNNSLSRSLLDRRRFLPYFVELHRAGGVCGASDKRRHAGERLDGGNVLCCLLRLADVVGSYSAKDILLISYSAKRTESKFLYYIRTFQSS